MAFKSFKGSTSGGQEIARTQQAADAPFLNAKFWEEGVQIAARVLTTHKSSNGPYVCVRLLDAQDAAEFFPEVDCSNVPGVLEVEGEEVVCVRIGNLAGITLARMEALSGAKKKYFEVGDVVFFACTGITKAEKEGHSDSPNFYIEVAREEAEAAKL